jgi:DNA-binding MurR/RpiR family transcriptional regulator
MDTSAKPRLISELKRQIPTLSPRMAQVAKYILDHPSDFGLDSIRDTATKARVSTYSLIRVAQHLGFDGFEGLRAPFRHALVTATARADQPEWIATVQAQGDLGRAQAEAALNSVSIVQRSVQQEADKMQRVVALLGDANRVYLTGARASHALAYYFHYVGRIALPSLDLIPRHHGSARDD